MRITPINVFCFRLLLIFLSIPLVEVKLQSDLVIEQVRVCTVDKLLIKGVTFLSGIDLAGGWP